MKIRMFLPVMLIAYLLACCISCAKEEGNTTPEERLPFTDTVTFSVSPVRLNLFEKTDYAIYKKDKNGDRINITYNLMTQLDSLIWDTPEVFYDVCNIDKMIVSREQSYYLPGTYKTVISLYRDSSMILTESVEVTVELVGDFLGIDWEEDALLSNRYNYVSNVKNFTLGLSYIQDEVAPLALLGYWINNYNGREEHLAQLASIRPFFYDYITLLYGKSAFLYEGDDLSQSPLHTEYEKRFSYPLEELFPDISYFPLAIWDTDSSHIILIGSLPGDPGVLEISNYYVLAEPRKF
ncbi:hypothetical protein M2459_003318 [Parabacteroides sp. PF5-5]|uniref:hypothetical protein n=1 Tax=unclassified Parabacteroides TaxID=2649774 RepID=UPI002473EF97|nr:MULTISPECIES: hypothetical protein [unclassified Parabacteroides]MDH6306593.1 hypothetical protein [Parabacteroides sp. PH5-39]MDH6317560.1 hypothetical protein [Parabacteroides sp. PF5-13]MDH6321304.1 hypothetical protein [Parabacteroides sp. PH5-13]MDH6325036.1 hypothetical protein [Parabacteroides sp. PH5-8]MDH6328745.1 hypothetical protein [Parabacteroides sp. PH5-41]